MADTDRRGSLPRYVRFQLEHVTLPCLNLCVGANPGNLEGPGIVHCDIERWRYRNFVQCDAHWLPFRDDAFDTVLSGDCLEHFVDPLKALREMRRVGRRTVLTTFQEWRLPGVGQHIAAGYAICPRDTSQETHERFLAAYPETLVSHIPHINQWQGPEELFCLFEAAGFRTTYFGADCPGLHDGHPIVNYLFVLDRKGS